MANWYIVALSFSSTWTTTLTAPSATVASLRTSAPCGRGTRGRPRPRSPGLAAGRWTSGGLTPLEAEGEEGAGGDATAGRSEREMVRHEWEMSYIEPDSIHNSSRSPSPPLDPLSGAMRLLWRVLPHQQHPAQRHRGAGQSSVLRFRTLPLRGGQEVPGRGRAGGGGGGAGECRNATATTTFEAVRTAAGVAA